MPPPTGDGTTMKGTTAMARAASTPEATPEAPAEEAQQTDAQKRRAAYSAAEARLREENSDRFRALVNEEAAARGVEYKFKRTEEEKARDRIAELFAKYPNIEQEIRTPQPLPTQ